MLFSAFFFLINPFLFFLQSFFLFKPFLQYRSFYPPAPFLPFPHHFPLCVRLFLSIIPFFLYFLLPSLLLYFPFSHSIPFSVTTSSSLPPPCPYYPPRPSPLPPPIHTSHYLPVQVTTPSRSLPPRPISCLRLAT